MQRTNNLVKLSEILSLREEKPGIDEILSGKIPIIAKIVFDSGEIEFRNKRKTKTEMILIRPGDLVISGINAIKGAIAIYQAENEVPAAATIHYSSYSINEKKVIPLFLWYFMRSNKFKQILLENLPKGIKTEIKPKRFLPLEIPLPSLEVQTNIVLKITKSRALTNKAITINQRIIDKTEKLLKSIRSYYFSTSNPIGEIEFIKDSGLELNRENRNPSIKNPNDYFLYLDISSVEGQTGRILDAKKLRGSEAPSRARRVIRAGDVLISTVRPYLKSFTIVPEYLDNQICSTGFAVFSCPKEIIPEFLLHQFFSDFFVSQCVEKMSGAHYPAINISQLNECKIILPPLAEQKKIIRNLDEFISIITHQKRIHDEIHSYLFEVIPSISEQSFSS